MADLLKRMRKLSKAKWQPTVVEEVTLSGGASDIAVSNALKVARAIKIRAPLHDLAPAGEKEFSMSGMDVVAFTSCDDDCSYHEFLFERISDLDRGDEFAVSLMERRKEPNWPVSEWIKSSIERGDCLVGVKDANGVLSGFIAYSRGLEIVAGDEDDDVEALYTVHVEFLYVSPEARGQNMSTALMAVVMSDVLDDVDHLSRKIASSREKLPEFSFRSRLTAEAHSSGGERFLDMLHYNMADSVNLVFGLEESPDDSVERDYSS